MTLLPADAVLLRRVASQQARIADARVRLLPLVAERERLASLLHRVDNLLREAHTVVMRDGATEHALRALRDATQATDRVLTEALALAVGTLARQAGVDDGACEESDLFVAQLAARADRRYARATVPAGAEYVHRAVDVIRRRVPTGGFWDLPVMAHELAHVVIGVLQPYDPRTDQVHRPAEAVLRDYQGMARVQAEELFCDVLATYAVGPAYACTLVFDRLDPLASAVTQARATHPSDARRVHGCMLVLRELRTLDGGVASPYDLFLTVLPQVWTDLQRDAAASSRLDAEGQSEVARDVAAFLAVLLQQLPTLRHRWTDAAVRAPDMLRSGGDPPAGLSACDVLNAAWRLRLRAWLGEELLPADFEERAKAALRASLHTAEAEHAR